MKKSALTVSLLLVLAVSLGGAGLAAWEGGDATNNDDGGNDQPASGNSTDSSTSSDDTSYSLDGGEATPDPDNPDNTEAASSSSSWTGGDATNDDDGSGTTTTKEWTGGNATNDDDGQGTNRTETWEGGNATNNDDGTGTTGVWTGGNATNNDDGSGTTWTGGNATNNDDGTSTAADGGNSTDSNRNYGSNDGADGSESDSQDQEETNEDGSDDDSEEQPELEPRITSSVWPDTVKAGETVHVTGNVVGIEDTELAVYMGSQTVATTPVNDQESFETTFTAEEVGTHTVEVSAAGLTDTHQVEVTPLVEIDSVTWPDSVEKGENFKVCPQVSSQEMPEVTLFMDGVQVDSKQQKGVVCFDTEIKNTGDHRLKVQAEVDGDTASKSTTVNAYTVSTGTVQQEKQGALGSFANSMSSNIFLIIAAVLAVVLIGAGVKNRR